MKNITYRLPLAAILVAFVFSLSALNAFAQEAAQAAADVVAETALALTWQQALIPVLTPLIIAGVKMLLPRIPKMWLPLAAPVVGLLIDLVSHFALQTELSPMAALALGAAGVGLREAQKQVVATLGKPSPGNG